MMKKKLSLQHLYRPSSLQNNPPAIIMLHGYGSDEQDLFSFASELPSEYAIISLKAPRKLQPYGNAWYEIHFDAPNGKWSDDEQAKESRELVSNVIDEIIEQYQINSKKITLLGFSQGTILSFSIALSYPEKIKNVIGLSGYVNANIIMGGIETRNFEGLSVYTSHGLVDQVIPVEWARKSKPFFEALGIPCTYSEYQVGHGVSPQNFYEFKEWLSKQD